MYAQIAGETMDYQEYLRNIGLEESVAKLHHAITEKFALNGLEFDAWYTNREHVYQNIEKLAQSTASTLRENSGFNWVKSLPEPLERVLKARNIALKNWEDGPDGTLAGIAILLAAWVANQAAQKSRDNPTDAAKKLFEEWLQPLIIAAMQVGVSMGERP